MVGVLSCQIIIFCTNELSKHKSKGKYLIQNDHNTALKQTKLVQNTTDTGGSK